MKKNYDELLDLEITEKQMDLAIPNEQYNFYENFINNNVIIDVTDIFEFDLYSFYVIYISMYSNDEKDFSEIIGLAKGNIEKIIDLPDPILKQVFLLSFSKKFEEAATNNDNSVKFASSLIDADLKVIAKLFQRIDIEKAFSLFSITKVVNEIKRDKKIFESAFIRWQKKHDENLNAKTKSMIFNEYLDDNFELSELLNRLKETIDYAVMYTKEFEKSRKNLNKELNNLLDSKKWLKENIIEGKYTKEIPQCIIRLNNEDLKYTLLNTIYDHNKSYLDELSKEYTKLNSDEKKLIISLLNKYNINYNNVVVNFSYEDLKYILSDLEKQNITNPKLLINILQITDIETFNTIISYIKTGYISVKFVENNFKVFDKNTKEYLNLSKNITLLNNINIGIHDFIKASNILLFDTATIAKNINILDKYSFTSNLNGLTNYNFLVKDNLDIKIDILIENGYEEYLKNNLYILNYDLNNYKILYLLNELDQKNELSISKLLSNNKYFINYDNINDYIFNYLDYINISNEDKILKIDIISNLERKLISRNLYNIDGILVSKNKVMEQINSIDNNSITIKDLFNIITKKMVLKQEEIAKVYKFIANKELSEDNKKMVKI